MTVLPGDGGSHEGIEAECVHDAIIRDGLRLGPYCDTEGPFCDSARCQASRLPGRRTIGVYSPAERTGCHRLDLFLLPTRSLMSAWISLRSSGSRSTIVCHAVSPYRRRPASHFDQRW